MFKYLFIGIVMCMNSATLFADTITIKSDAPQVYTVQKGDTLWDISSLFLDQPWLWPELWRQNTQIENPHLIYPGDQLQLSYVDGAPVLSVVREKSSISITPMARVSTKPAPINVLPWQRLNTYIKNDIIMTREAYQRLPSLLGDAQGTPRFSVNDYVLSEQLDTQYEQYHVLRIQREISDSQGTSLGYQIDYLSDAELLPMKSGEQNMVRLSNNRLEAKQGDKLLPVLQINAKDLRLQAAIAQSGELVGNVEGRPLSGKNDVVILNLGQSEIEVGTVMGIYQQGPMITKGHPPSYATSDLSLMSALSLNKTIEQPALKIGELIVFKTFKHASYAWITQATTHVTGGEVVAKP